MIRWVEITPTRFSSSYVTLIEYFIIWQKILFYFWEEWFMKNIEKAYWGLLSFYYEFLFMKEIYEWISSYEEIEKHRINELLFLQISFNDCMVVNLFLSILKARVCSSSSCLCILFICPHWICVTYPIPFLQICRVLSSRFLGFAFYLGVSFWWAYNARRGSYFINSNVLLLFGHRFILFEICTWPQDSIFPFVLLIFWYLWLMLGEYSNYWFWIE